MASRLISTEAFTKQQDDGADVKFVREHKGVHYTIRAGWSTQGTTWFQWGAPKNVIEDNAPTARQFFVSKISYPLNIKR